MENKKTEHKTFPLPDKKKAKSGIKKWIKFIWIAECSVSHRARPSWPGTPGHNRERSGL